MTNKWRWIGIIVIAIFILGVGGKLIMDKKLDTTRKSLEKDYQQGVELIQNYVTDYLVNNYEGIEKIEWQGIGVEWRNSPIHGESMLGNYVKSEVDIFVSEEVFFTMKFKLSDKAEYSNENKKYYLSDSLNSENIDTILGTGIENKLRKLGDDEKLLLSAINKSNKGSKNSEVIKNIKIYELEY